MTTANKMSKLSVNKLIIQMSLPPLFSMFLQYSYNFIDSIFIAKLGEDALAAVSLSFPITTLMNSLSVWIVIISYRNACKYNYLINNKTLLRSIH